MPDFKDIPFNPSCPGERWKVEFESIVQADGTIELREAGKTDLQEFYDSQAASCDMALIIIELLKIGLTSFAKLNCSICLHNGFKFYLPAFAGT